MMDIRNRARPGLTRARTGLRWPLPWPLRSSPWLALGLRSSGPACGQSSNPSRVHLHFPCFQHQEEGTLVNLTTEVGHLGIYYICNVIVHKFCVFNIVNIICFTGPAEELHYNIVFQHILCIRNTVNVVLRLSSRGVQFFFRDLWLD